VFAGASPLNSLSTDGRQVGLVDFSIGGFGLFCGKLKDARAYSLFNEAG
jgi:hypothetical protein